MPDFDRALFASHVSDFLATAKGGEKLTYDEAIERWPELNKAMISRGATGDRPLSAGNILALCRRFGLDPFDYLVLAAPVQTIARQAARGKPRTIKDLLKQHVSRRGSRETISVLTPESSRRERAANHASETSDGGQSTADDDRPRARETRLEA